MSKSYNDMTDAEREQYWYEFDNHYTTWLLSGNPLNELIASYIVHLKSIPAAAEAAQMVLRYAREETTEVTQFLPKWSSNMLKLTVGYANLCATMSEDTQACWKCGGEQEVVSEFSFTGFAGGSCYHAELACGHVNADESGDLRAAL